MKRLSCTIAALVCLTGCAAAPVSPAPPVRVPLTCSCKAAPLTDDPTLTGGRFGMRGDKLVLTGYDDDWTRVIGLYDTASGETVKTALPQTDGSIEICGFDWQDGVLTVLTAEGAKETFSGDEMTARRVRAESAAAAFDRLHLVRYAVFPIYRAKRRSQRERPNLIARRTVRDAAKQKRSAARGRCTVSPSPPPRHREKGRRASYLPPKRSRICLSSILTISIKYDIIEASSTRKQR